MIRANDKGLNTPPPVIVEGEPKRRLPIPKLTPRTLLFVVGGLAWVILLVVVLTQVLGRKAPAAGEAAKASAPAAAQAETRSVAQPVVTVAPSTTAPVAVGPKAEAAPEIALKDRVVNLSNGTGYKYVKMTAVVIFEDSTKKFAKAKGENLSKLQEAFAADNAGAVNAFNDILTTTVSAKSAAELSTPQGKEALRQDLINRFNQALGGTQKVTWVDFTDFVMQ